MGDLEGDVLTSLAERKAERSLRLLVLPALPAPRPAGDPLEKGMLGACCGESAPHSWLFPAVWEGKEGTWSELERVWIVWGHVTVRNPYGIDSEPADNHD